VQVEDGNGLVDTSFNGPVTIGLDVLATGYLARLSGTLTVNAVKGVATFSGLSVDLIGSYDLTIRSLGLAGTTTNVFNVTPAAASQLAVRPNGMILAGAPFTLTVDALDPAGNRDTTFTGSVTVALGNNPGGST